MQTVWDTAMVSTEPSARVALHYEEEDGKGINHEGMRKALVHRKLTPLTYTGKSSGPLWLRKAEFQTRSQMGPKSLLHTEI